MNTVQIICRSVTMEDICRHYGFAPNRAGFIKCPFHPGDNTASLKIYPGDRGWHCFGCNKGGSIVDFVMLVLEVDFKRALQIINDEFNIGLPMHGKLNYREKRIFQKRYSELEVARQAEERIREAKKAEYDYWLNEYVCMDLIIRYLKPQNPEEELSDAYVYAMHRMPVIEFMLDCIKG